MHVLASLATTLVVNVLTYQYDNTRAGVNSQEVILTPVNVNAAQFGKLFAQSVDGLIYGQPLYLAGVAIPGKGTHNVVYVATEHDSVYAFDADSNQAPLWLTSFLSTGVTTVPASDTSCSQIAPEIGITGTPVIDPQSGAIYVVAMTKESGNYVQRLHALDVATGAEKPGSPVVIRASVTPPSSGLGALFSSAVEFRALHDNPRAALLLANGVLYLSWASSCDVMPYHGWVIGYEARTLKQVAVFNASPRTGLSGIWQGDAGPAADQRGDVYVVTANGVFDAASGGPDYGDSILKLSLAHGSLTVKDYFTPYDQAHLNATDSDLGSGGPILVPQQPGSHKLLVIAGGKGGVLYVLDPDHMGKFHPHDNSGVLSEARVAGQIFGAPAYWNGHVYVQPDDDVATDFALHHDELIPMAHSSNEYARAGATPAISANGDKDAILWIVSSREPGPGAEIAVLHAVDGTNIANELYSSSDYPQRDRAGNSLRFVIPTIANGRVYVGSERQVDAYGLLPQPVRTAPARKASGHKAH